jgi:fucose permease
MATFFLIIIYAAFISLGLPDSLLGVAWPAMQPGYHVPFSFAGFISMIISGGTIVSSLLSSRFLKRFGTGKVTFISVFMTAIALLGFSFAPSFIWLLFLAIPLGLGAGAVDSGLNAYIAEHYKSHHMSWLHCFWGIGAMLGPIIISQYISHNSSWRNSYLTVSIIQFVLVVVLFFALPLWDKVASLSKIDSSETEAIEQESDTAPKDLLYPLKVSGVKIALVSFLFYCGIESTMGLWGSSFFVKAKGLDVATAAGWVSFFYGSITVGRLISGFITMKVNNKILIRTGELTIFTGAILLLLPLPNIFSLVGFILMGLGCAPIYPCMLHETPVRFGKEDAQAIMGFQMAVAYIGSTFLPPLFGFIASNTTMTILPFFILTYIIVMLVSSEKVNLFMKKKYSA